jgi:hypothetical protein
MSEERKDGASCGQLLAVFAILIVGALIINAIGGDAFSLSRALGIPDWVIPTMIIFSK